MVTLSNNPISFDLQEMRSPAFLDAYTRYGAVIVRNVLEPAHLDALKRTLCRILRSLLQNKGVDVEEHGDIDVYYQQLTAIGEELGGAVIRIVRDLPEYYQLMCHPNMMKVIETLLQDNLFQVVHDISLFRIDPPIQNHHRKFDWHQDYHYNVLSRSAITAWVPLTAVAPDMGPLKIIPESHREMLPVCFNKGYALAGKGTGHKVFSLRECDTQSLDSRCLEVQGMQAGDILFFHSLLLHASGDNRSTDGKSRWVFNYRYGHLMDPEVVKRQWRVVRDRDPYYFTELHPDLVIYSQTD